MSTFQHAKTGTCAGFRDMVFSVKVSASSICIEKLHYMTMEMFFLIVEFDSFYTKAQVAPLKCQSQIISIFKQAAVS